MLQLSITKTFKSTRYMCINAGLDKRRSSSGIKHAQNILSQNNWTVCMPLTVCKTRKERYPQRLFFKHDSRCQPTPTTNCHKTCRTVIIIVPIKVKQIIVRVDRCWLDHYTNIPIKPLVRFVPLYG